LKADTAWHFDGPRVTPHHLYAVRLPLVLKVGWWLTDLTGSDAVNFVYLPGSHRSHQFSAARTFEPVAGEVHLQVPAGSITLMHGGLWHRVLANRSERVRRNLFFGYCPSWLAPQETYQDILDAPIKLTRRRRILLREYTNSYERETPPDEDLPLLEGTGVATEYGPLVRKGHRRYPLRIERLLL
jgi:ectoine hydroxylase-related dioxygenase (phytanoyl-CoA dioxygenase family)